MRIEKKVSVIRAYVRRNPTQWYRSSELAILAGDQSPYAKLRHLAAWACPALKLLVERGSAEKRGVGGTTAYRYRDGGSL